MLQELLKKIEEVLRGIDKEEAEENGWWETSEGKAFGKKKLEEIRNAFAEAENQK